MKQITDLFDRHGENRYGEHVNQREHMLQCAKLAEDAGDTPAMIAAALLHDVGQFLEGAGDAAEAHGHDAAHERLGEVFLSQWFPEEVTAPIFLHVAAKRYLCAVEPGYMGDLSGASALSLSLQGGPFDEAECRTFEAHPFFKEAIRLRRYDDAGKQPGMATPDIDHYVAILNMATK
ncbi:phosphonate degradation HD-domain oxygenase [Brevundimonas sp.]|uniref:phosphonate degradation HD-domain oxygenase n=1 Tax=Brevundimonas sp. TaxID=1871086 RepID=UPI0025C51832|nr:phosphonate degradation HD-domain oxygenase [Brevundimonas sp.]